MKELPTSFGLTIAFLVPGLITLYAVSFFVPEVRTWLTGADAGGAILAVVFSAGFGVLVSNARWLLFEKALKWYANGPQLNHSAREREGVEAAFQALIANHYDFYLFGLNTTVASWLALTAWWAATGPSWGTWIAAAAACAASTVVLVLAGRNAMDRYHEKAAQLLGHYTPLSPPGPSQ